LNFPIDLRIIDTMREPDGLAMSSRNRYLTPHQRELAPILAKALFKAQEIVVSGKEFRREPIVGCALSALQHPDVLVDYVSLASMDDGMEIAEIKPHTEALLSAAIKIGTTRLIDNVIIKNSLL